MSNDRSLIGSVFERTTSHAPTQLSSRFTGSPGTGFPAAQHRFKSTFARARDEANTKSTVGGPRRADVPPVAPNRLQTLSQRQRQIPIVPTSPIVDSQPIPTDTDALLRQIDEENARKIERMSDDEIEREKSAILEQLGEGTGLLLRRVQEARRRKAERERETQAQAGMDEKVAPEAHGMVEEVTDGDDACQATERDHDSRERSVLVASPTPRRVSDGLAARPSVLRVKSLDDIGRTVPSPLPAASSTRPSSRTGRRLRFAEVTPNDVHVYESAPTSPKRAALALPPPPDKKDDSIVSLGTLHKDAIPAKRPHSTDSPTEEQPTRAQKADDEPEEGTPEYIHRRYFPNVPTDDPSLAWIEAPSAETTDPSTPRFDLHGVPIPASVSSSLPSHLGLHHHAEGTHAGYTIDDIFLLARSTVPAQRASMFGILAKITRRLGLQARQPGNRVELVFAGQEGQLRKRVLAAGLTAIDQTGSLGARAIEVVWECLVGWNGTTGGLEGAELALAPDVVSSLQLDYFLPQITEVLLHAALPSESLAQLLAILHWLAQQSNQIADMITATPRLVPTILNAFLLTPIPPKEGSVLPNPLALQILITLASASRSNALALLDPADALLRFVTLLPPSSPYPPALAITLLTYTLQFYAALASYGLYSHIATTASQIFTDLASYILSDRPSLGSASGSDSTSRQLRIDWASLVHAWTVCATDPHATSPPHDILWSQIRALGWATDMRKLRQGLGGETSDWPLYAAMWDSESAWLEGARINGIKGGEEEREEALQVLSGTFAIEDGTEFRVVRRALEAMERGLGDGGPTTIKDGERVLKSLANAGSVLASALRLWLACLPPLNDGVPLSIPPFALPLSELSALSATLVKHPIWSLPSALGAIHFQVYLRPLTCFVNHFHRVSRHIPGTTPQLWFAQALVFLFCLLPGDETCALAMLDTFALVTPQFVGIDTAELPQNISMGVLRPFFEYAVWPEREVYVAPLRPNKESILRASTLRLPSSLSLSPSPSTRIRGSDVDDVDDTGGHLAHTHVSGLPLTRDFLFTPLTHLLRSGASPVFRALPDDWTASEVDVVRATLLLAYAARKVLIAHGLDGFVHGAVEVVFACMRVCMLEHGVGVGAGVDVEVFRDAAVERLMAWLLDPFTVRARSESHSTSSPVLPHAPRTPTLEDASAPHLGSTPFYQFYTDLVALYGAVSFGHRVFAAVVVVPLAMHYAVDYRRVLWCGGDGAGVSSGSSSGADADVERAIGGGGGGLGDVVRSVRIPLEEVVCTVAEGDPREYLYPVERDVGVLGAYVAALVTRDGGRVQGFLRFVAVHHIACTVWRDLERDANTEAEAKEGEMETEAGRRRREEMRARLLRVVIVRGEDDVVRDVVLYRQHWPSQGPFVWPPKCYQGREDEDEGRGTVEWREERLAYLTRAMGEGAAERVRTLFMSTA